MDTLRVVVLGPVAVTVHGRAACLGGLKARTVLAALSISPNQAVADDTLVAAVWGGNPPRSARDSLQSIVSRLRKELGRDVIERANHGYRLVIDPGHVDAVVFELLVGEASALVIEDPAAAASRANDALSLWQGTAFGDLRDLSFFEAEASRLEELKLAALEIRMEAEVSCGRREAAIAGLEAAVSATPYRERLWYLLVLALARDGRRVEALRTCQRVRAILGEIGLEPSAGICELEQMVIDEAPVARSLLDRSDAAPST